MYYITFTQHKIRISNSAISFYHHSQTNMAHFKCLLRSNWTTQHANCKTWSDSKPTQFHHFPKKISLNILTSHAFHKIIIFIHCFYFSVQAAAFAHQNWNFTYLLYAESQFKILAHYHILLRKTCMSIANISSLSSSSKASELSWCDVMYPYPTNNIRVRSIAHHNMQWHFSIFPIFRENPFNDPSRQKYICKSVAAAAAATKQLNRFFSSPKPTNQLCVDSIFHFLALSIMLCVSFICIQMPLRNSLFFIYGRIGTIILV